MSQWIRRIRWLAAWLLGLYLADLYVRMGWIKFQPDGFWTDAFARWGYPGWLRVSVGVIEVVGGVLLLVPWVASYAALAVAAVMVGAGVTRFGDGRMVDVGWIALYGVGLLWIAYEWWGVRWRPGATRAAALVSARPDGAAEAGEGTV